MDWTLLLDLATGEFTVRRASRPADDGLMAVCPTPHLTTLGLRVLTVDYATEIGDVLADDRDGDTGYPGALDVLAMRVHAALHAPRGLARYERYVDVTDDLMDEVDARGITATTTDDDLAAMACADIAEEQAAAEVPGAILTVAPGLVRGYTGHRNALLTARTVAPPPTPLEAATASLRAAADTPGLWDEECVALRVLASPETAEWAASHIGEAGRMDWLALRLDTAALAHSQRCVLAVALTLLSPVETISLRDLRGTLDNDVWAAVIEHMTHGHLTVVPALADA